MDHNSVMANLLPAAMRTKHALLDIVRRLRGSHAQFAQDLWLLKHAYPGKQKGFFVEVGAADGIGLSNTLLLEQRGWRGMCIEADATAFDALQRNRNCVCLHACVYDKATVARFASNLGVYGGIIDTYHKQHLANIERFHGMRINNANDLKNSETMTTTLADIFERENVPFHIEFMSLDIEGAELQALKSFPFATHVVGCMMVEHLGITERKRAIRALLSQHGYRVAYEHRYEDYFFHHSLGTPKR